MSGRPSGGGGGSVRPSGLLARGLGTRDGILITIGSIVGTGIFITTGDIARVLPHAGLILAVWIAAGLMVIAGALTYGEMGALFPRAGGQYHFLKEAYGPLPGFLFGWAAFWVTMSGGIATLAVGFGQYLGAFVPFFSIENVLCTVRLGFASVKVSGGQIAGALAIAILTAINCLGLREGTRLQNALTALKIAAIVGLAAVGIAMPAAPGAGPIFAKLPSGSIAAAIGVGMIAALWSYDGWYNLTFSAGEMRRPERSLPKSLIVGTLAVLGLYLLINLAYVRALPVSAMAETQRIGEAAATALLGREAAALVSLAVVISTFGCLSSSILCCSRIYLAMAEDGLFFRSIATVHPRYRTPVRSLWAQGAWSMLLTLSGTYEQLYTYVMFASILFHTATGAAVFVLRRKRPDLPRPYRTWGYPVVPAIFLLSSAALVVNTLGEKPHESLYGLGLLALGIPAFAWWRRREARRVPNESERDALLAPPAA